MPYSSLCCCKPEHSQLLSHGFGSWQAPETLLRPVPLPGVSFHSTRHDCYSLTTSASDRGISLRRERFARSMHPCTPGMRSRMDAVLPAPAHRPGQRAAHALAPGVLDTGALRL